MKAAQIDEYGEPTQVIVRDITPPTPSDDQVLIEVKAASLNPFDTTIRSGAMKDAIPLAFPVTLGGDIAGVVAEVGADVSGVSVGDAVYGQANVVAGNSGAFAEYAVTAVTQIAPKPTNATFEEAASLVLVGVSALQALGEHLNLQKDQRIFIHGGAGGIGTIAIQIARVIGAHIVTTAKAEDAGYVKSLGAQEIIDYETTDFTQVVHDVDAVFDTVGRDDFAKTLQTLKAGGTAVSMIAPPDKELAEQLGVTAMMQQTRVTPERLAKLTALIEQGAVKPQIAKSFPLDKIVDAFTDREAGHSRGKIVITIE